MKRTLVVTADLGRFKAFRLVKHRGDSHAHLELFQEKRHEELRHRLSELVTDSAGGFPKAAGAHKISGNMSVGERHNIRSEQERRAVQSIAAELNALLRDDVFAACWIAVPRPIHMQLLGGLDAAAKAKIEKTIWADLTKLKAPDLLTHLESAA